MEIFGGILAVKSGIICSVCLVIQFTCSFLYVKVVVEIFKFSTIFVLIAESNTFLHNFPKFASIFAPKIFADLFDFCTGLKFAANYIRTKLIFARGVLSS